MAATEHDLKTFFSKPGQPELATEVLLELQSIARLHSLPAEEVYIKWEAYSIKMGSDETRLDYNTVRAFKKDIQDMLEREARSSTHVRGSDKKGIHATPRAPASNDVFGMLVAPADSHIKHTEMRTGSTASRPLLLEFRSPMAQVSGKQPSRLQPPPRSSGPQGGARQQMAERLGRPVALGQSSATLLLLS